MTSSFADFTDSRSHPINLLEELIISKNWVFERPIEDEIYIEVPTKYSNLIIQVTWLKNQGRIEIKSFFYNKMDFTNNAEVYKLLNLINNKIDYGHFVIDDNFSLSVQDATDTPLISIIREIRVSGILKLLPLSRCNIV